MGNNFGSGSQGQETEALRKEIHEIRQRVFGSNQPIEPSSLPQSSIGRKLGTIGAKFKSLTRFKTL